MSERNVAYTIIVQGNVVGVGFRTFVWRVANRLKLVGYVANISEDKVLIHVKGHEENIEKLKRIILNNQFFEIKNIEIRKTVDNTEYSGFTRLQCFSTGH